MARSVIFRNGQPADEDVDPPPDQTPELGGPDTIAWVGCAPTSSSDLDAAATITGIARDRIDTALTPHPRHRLWRIDSHYVINTHILDSGDDTNGGAPEPTLIVILVAQDSLVTCCDDPDIDVGSILTDTADTDAVARFGTTELLRALLEWLISGYQQAALDIDEGTDDIEESLFSESATAADRVQRDTYGLQRRLVTLRRCVLPLREDLEALRHLTPNTDHNVTEQLPIRQLDHLLNLIESLREMLVSILSTNLNLQQNRLNQTMKKLTGWAAVIAIPTFITSWYGMNVMTPGQFHLGGTLLASAMVLGAAIGMYTLFRHKDWL